MKYNLPTISERVLRGHQRKIIAPLAASSGIASIFLQVTAALFNSRPRGKPDRIRIPYKKVDYRSSSAEQTWRQTLSTQIQGFHQAIKLRNAVALYASSVLGPGVLVLPGLAAKIAGPGSILAWILLALASYPFGYTFATLSARRPETGGVYAFAREAFGFRVATVTGWLFALWMVTGAPAVVLIAASYIGYAFPLNRAETFIVAVGIILSAFLVNYRGIVLSNKVQLAVIGSIITLLLVAIASSSFSVSPQNFTPLLPNGLIPVGTAAALIFWSYLGYENVSNVAEEFENPERDFHRSIIFSVLLISILYIAIAIVTVGTRAYEAGGSVAPFAVILSNLVGNYAAVGTAVLAVFIIFGVVNAYTTGMSRVFYSVARDGGFPKAIDHINKRTKAPDRALLAMLGCILPIMVVYFFANVDLETALLVSSGSAISVYVIGSAAGTKILGKNSSQRKDVMFPIISLAISIVVLPFVGPLLTATAATIIAALAYIKVSEVRRGVAGESLEKIKSKSSRIMKT